MKLKILLFFVRNYLEILALFSKNKAGEKAFQIFSKPRKGRLSEQDRKYLDSSERQVFNLNNIKIQTYIWRGNDKIVLLLHGWESNAARWKSLVKLLRKKGYTVVAMDAPAHGDSGSQYFHPPLYAEMLQVVTEQFPPYAIVGHSVGGYTAAYFQNFHAPLSVEKLVLMAPSCDNRLIFNTYLKYIGVSARVKESFYLYTKTHFKREPESVLADKFAQNFKQKGLIIHDKNDAIVGYEEGKKIHAAWENARYVETENLGHSLRNEGVHKLIVEFLNENNEV
jgi:pimeloyl-ACP methyl ester carboxylesterase